ncbi:MAG: YggS family pyridoxal phosphate-dependent enzyme [Clostridia bacterium]|nr:YggS family pyridoxal phosphate-dependent enzyme [Clostridia bacterium]
MAYDKAKMAEGIAQVRENIEKAALSAGRKPQDILLCAVCKTQPTETVRESAELDVDLFGENHMQELVANFDGGAYLGRPVHFIGHLQTNKVKKVVGRANIIESVDSLHLLEAIEKEAFKQGTIQDILFELNIGAEETKTGAPVDALWSLFESAEGMKNIRVRGLMAIPPAFDNSDESRRHFEALRKLFEKAKERSYQNALLDTLSMGMSASFEAAIKEGSTLVRIGTAIYGPRNYTKV